jgi:two-component system response regulator YesN
MRLEPDVVVLDFLIGGRDPIQEIRSLRENFPRLKVVVYTGYPDQDLSKRAFLAGAFRVVLKTIDSFAIKQAIRAAAAADDEQTRKKQ